MLNISTEYPLLKGEPDAQLLSLQNTVCSLLDELKYILPQIDSNINSIRDAGSVSDGSAEES